MPSLSKKIRNCIFLIYLIYIIYFVFFLCRLFGLLVALIEAPFLCMFLDFAQVPSAYFDGKPPWMRGLLYIV